MARHPIAPLPPFMAETWQLGKAVLRSERGAVATQSAEAAAVGAGVLDSGGNAVDAAIATALALCITEPWMSGLGGGGFMLVHDGATSRTFAIDFTMVAPLALDPAAYAPAGAPNADPVAIVPVIDDRNGTGPLSFCVPGAVAGYATAVERFGRWSWQKVVEPAARLAEQGHLRTWWTTLNVAAEASRLAEFPASRSIWLPEGLPPNVTGDRHGARCGLGGLAATLARLAEAGPQDFYRGALARSILADMRAAGGTIVAEDFARLAARVVEPLQIPAGRLRLKVPGGLTAGPTLVDARRRLGALAAVKPSPRIYGQWAAALRAAILDRLAVMGHAGERGERGSTSHVSAADADGNMVSLTTTLLSRFGSAVLLPETGILMNNGVLWFDPRPDTPNRLAPGVRPLTNMVPLLATDAGKALFALGASGGRRILPCVFQLAALLADHGYSLGEAFAAPRFDLSAAHTILADHRLGAATIEALAEVARVEVIADTVFPAHFATPSGVMVGRRGIEAAAHVPGPVHGAAATGGDAHAPAITSR